MTAKRRSSLRIFVQIGSFPWLLLIHGNTSQGQSGSLYQNPVRPSNFQAPVTPQSNPNTGLQNPDAQLFPPNTVNPMASMGAVGNGGPNGMNPGLQGSWTFIPPSQARVIRLYDVVSIRVDESANSLMLGDATSRKSTAYNAVVRDWVRMVGIDTIKPAPQSDGDPRVQVDQNEVYRGNSTMRSTETLTFNIAAQVVDILPNGLLVLEGTTTIDINDNALEISLLGTCRSQDIGPDNTVLSRNLVNKRIKKKEEGHVRDGYSRGWLTRVLAKVKPF